MPEGQRFADLRRWLISERRRQGKGRVPRHRLATTGNPFPFRVFIGFPFA
jgi:hypothetical protein